MSPEVVGKLNEAFKDDFTVEEACRYAGIHKDTYYEECKRNPSFADEMSRAQDYPLTLAKKRIMLAMRNPKADDALALKFLERRQRDRYSPKMTVEHEGTIATYNDLESAKKAKTVEEARALAEEED